MPVWAYADLQVLGQAIAATKSLNDDTLAAYMHGPPRRCSDRAALDHGNPERSP